MSVYATDLYICSSTETRVQRPQMLVDCVWASIFMFIALLNLVLNGTVLISVCLYAKNLKRTHFIILISLAVADILKVTPSILQAAALLQGPTSKIGNALCNSSSSTALMLVCLTTVHLMLESLNRMIAIVWPFKYYVTFTKKRLIFILSVIWILPTVIITVPPYFIFDDYKVFEQFRDRLYACSIKKINTSHPEIVKLRCFALTVSVVFFGIPLLVIAASYSKILRISLQHIKKIKLQEEVSPASRIGDDTSGATLSEARLSSSKGKCSQSPESELRQAREMSLADLNIIQISNQEDVAGVQKDQDKSATNLAQFSQRLEIGHCLHPDGTPDGEVPTTDIKKSSDHQTTLSVSGEARKSLPANLYPKTVSEVNLPENANKTLCMQLPEYEPGADEELSQISIKTCCKQINTQEPVSVEGANENVPPVNEEQCLQRPTSKVRAAAEVPKISIRQFGQDEAVSVTETDGVTRTNEDRICAMTNSANNLPLRNAQCLQLPGYVSGDAPRKNSLSIMQKTLKAKFRKKKKEIRAAKTLAGLLAAFVLCYTPVLGFTWHNMTTSNPATEQEFRVSRGLLALAFLHSAINPLIYCLRIAEFKASVKNTLKGIIKICKICKRC